MKRLLIIGVLFFLGKSIVNAQSFQTLGTGLRINGTVTRIEFDSLNNRMFVAGSFSEIDNVPANNIAWHDSTGWHAFGTGTYYEYVYALKFADGKLFVGGNFSSIDGVPLNHVGYWDGSSWNNMDGGIDGNVNEIEWYNSTLYVSGDFTVAGGIAVNHIAKWNGSSWKSVGTGPDQPDVHLKVLDDTLFVYGNFTSFNGIIAGKIISFDGTNWQPWSFSDTNYSISAVAKLDNDLIGLFYYTDWQIRKFDNGGWTILSSNLKIDGWYPFLVSFNNKLYFNEFYSSPNKRADLVTLDTTIVTYTVASSFEYNTDIEPGFIFAKEYRNSLYVVGNFNNCQNKFAAGLFKIEVGDSISFSSYSSINYQNFWYYPYGNTMFFDSVQNKIFAGGAFDFAGDTMAHCIAAWDGTKWSPLSEGFTDTLKRAYVKKIIKYNGELYAGGRFHISGNQVVNNIAKWNGTNWMPLGSGVNNIVKDMEVFDGNLYIVGDFDSVGGSPGHGIAKWNGSNWLTIPGLQSNGIAGALCVFNGKLIAGDGSFDNNHNMMEFDGTNWTPLPGLDVSNFLVINGNLYARTYYTYKVKQFKDSSWVDIGYNGAIYISGFNDKLIIVNGNQNYTDIAIDSAVYKQLCYYQVYETIQTDTNSFYITGYLPNTGGSGNNLNHIAKVTIELPNAQIFLNEDTICDHEYAFFNTANTDYVQEFQWSFPGGTPNASTVFAPIIKYTNPGSYDVSLKVTNAFGSDSIYYPNLIYVKSCPLSVEEVTDNNTVLIYPNPVSDFLHIKFPIEQSLKSITVTDLIGKKYSNKIFSRISTIGEILIDCSNLPKGMYMLIFQTDKKITAKKFVIQ